MKGAQLKAIRKRLGWTQERMAAELKVTSNTVARWERDERSISEPMAMLINTVAEKNKPAR